MALLTKVHTSKSRTCDPTKTKTSKIFIMLGGGRNPPPHLYHSCDSLLLLNLQAEEINVLSQLVCTIFPSLLLMVQDFKIFTHTV